VVGRLADPERMSGLSFEHLYSERVAFIVRPDHPLRKAAPFKLSEIAHYPVLVPSEGSIIRPMVERLLIANGIAALPDTIETVSMAFGRQYTRMTDAVWIISRGVVVQDIADEILAELPVATETTTGSVGLTTRSDAAPSVPALLLMQAIREVAAPAPPSARAGGVGTARSPGRAAAARS
jgi:LysR family pca operon transcriptional activator